MKVAVKHLRTGDIVGPTASPGTGYRVISSTFDSDEREIRVRVQHLPDGGIDTRVFDYDYADKMLPVQRET